MSVYSGTGNKQTGYGKGKKLGTGRWLWINGEWIKEGHQKSIKVSTYTPKDGYNGKDLVKLGDEIRRCKQLDGADKKEIDRRFKKDADNLITKRPSKELVQNISNDLIKGLKEVNNGR